ncbi:alpha-amylase family glycosyl hydrolase [Deinococcus misasensis]|uniref:alpha-amylase family glycosyl hydrolase n=1 Tax=Deinococcus misasensis TaxID=392413 RepID=UPI000556A49A|nr:alpha-amylase family glycosyl hydrolase [Deinococcus misasensis]
MIQNATVWHDHTPGYTEQLGARLGSKVKVRLKSKHQPEHVQLLLPISGEINEFKARAIPALDGEGFWYEADLPLQQSRTPYAWHLTFINDSFYFTQAGVSRVRRGYRDFFQYLAEHNVPEWVFKSCFYQIFVDRFRNGNTETDVRDNEYLYPAPETVEVHNRVDPERASRFVPKPVMKAEWGTPPDRKGDVHAHYGGDLEGITEAIPYLNELGVNALWLTPIFESPSNHKYDTKDYRTVDPHFGGRRAFDEMLARAHMSGIKVILDGVFNHTGDLHAMFQKALYNPGIPERTLFTWHGSDTPTYEAFFGVPTLPKVDYSSELAFQEFIDGPNSVVRYWLKAGIDGWRLDVAQMIGRKGTDEGNLEIHRRLKKAAREENPQAFIFGERFFDAEHALDGRGEDAVMNYHGFGLPVMEWLAQASGSFVPVQARAEEVVDLMWDAYQALPPQVALSQVNLIDSHDVARALYRLGNDKSKLRVALSMLYTYVGVPCMFYGTEVGLTQHEKGTMPFCRVTMPWEEEAWDLDLLSFTKKLIALRKSHKALQQGSLRFLLGSNDTIAYERSYTHENGKVDRVVVAVSNQLNPRIVSLDLPRGTYRNAITGDLVDPERVQLTGSLVLVAE